MEIKARDHGKASQCYSAQINYLIQYYIPNYSQAIKDWVKKPFNLPVKFTYRTKRLCSAIIKIKNLIHCKRKEICGLVYFDLVTFHKTQKYVLKHCKEELIYPED